MLAGWRGRSTPAVIGPGSVWSGDELLARAAGAAAHLRSLTVGPAPVAALLTSSPRAFAYVIAGASAGIPLALLGPRLTAHELAPCVHDLGSDILLTDPAFADVAREVAAECQVRVITVDDPDPSAHPLDLDPPADAIAFVLHTSGTTGLPKPVPYRQDRLAIRTRVNVDLCNIDATTVYATASPFHHIAGFGNYAVALAAGAAVVPVPRFTIESWRALSELGVTHALTVPTMLEMLLDAGALSLPALRTLQYGAAPIHPETLRRTLATIPDVGLVNLFGQTEGSPITCLSPEDHRAIAADGRDDRLASVGRAAPGVDLHIAHAGPDGIGEVVARAAHFFVTDDDGWLHTGDLGRLDPEGYLFLSGRRGDKIIRGGENVYPVEVEQVLEAHPAVREAAVVGLPDRRLGEVVKAVIVPNGDIDVEDLRAFARRRLAGFKVPAVWELADALPRNASGKLLRRQLTKGQ